MTSSIPAACAACFALEVYPNVHVSVGDLGRVLINGSGPDVRFRGCAFNRSVQHRL
jgi:hypothetical protein